MPPTVRLALLTLLLLATRASAAPAPPRTHIAPRLVLGEGHTESVWGLAYSPDGKRLATVAGNCIKLWDPVRGVVVANHRFPDTSTLQSAAFSPDGQWLAVGHDGIEIKSIVPDPLPAGPYVPAIERRRVYEVVLLHVSTGRRVALPQEHTGIIISAAFSPDGRLVASAGNDSGNPKSVRLWDVEARKQRAVLTGHTDTIAQVLFSPDGKTLVSTAMDNTLRVWDIATGRCTAKMEHERLALVAVGSDGKTLASAGLGGDVRFWDVATGKLQSTLHGSDWLHAVALSPDGRTVAAGAAAMGKANVPATIQRWELATGRKLAPLEGHRELVTALAFSPDGRQLASADMKGTLCFWDVASGKCLSRSRGPDSRAVTATFAPDGKSFLVVRADESLTRYNAATGAVLGVHAGSELNCGLPPPPANGGEVVINSSTDDAVFTPDGRMLATGGSTFSCTAAQKQIKIRDVASGKERLLDVDETDTNGLALSPDGRLLATASFSHGLRAWDATGRESKLLWEKRGRYASVVFSPDGKMLSAESDAAVTFLDPATGKEGRTIQVAPKADGAFWQQVFSPDGKVLVIGRRTGEILLWDVGSGQRLAALSGRTRDVRAQAFSPDGRTLATGDAEGKLRLWDAGVYREVARLASSGEPIHSLAFSPDGKSTIAACGNTVHVWDIPATGQNRDR